MNEKDAIEWALNKARRDLKQAGEAYRDPELRASWTWDKTGEARRTYYEERCNELRQGIGGLESALKTITAIGQFEGGE